MVRNKLLIIIAVILLATMVTVMCISVSRIRGIQNMNRQELHYDADGYFLMLNTKTGLLGFYDGTEPVRHLWVNDQIPAGIQEGVYAAYHAQNGLFLQSKENSSIVLVLKDSNEVPAGTPLLVYGGDKR